jgi:hypothetical protein
MKLTKVSPISHESIASAIALKIKTIISLDTYHNCSKAKAVLGTFLSPENISLFTKTFLERAVKSRGSKVHS